MSKGPARRDLSEHEAMGLALSAYLAAGAALGGVRVMDSRRSEVRTLARAFMEDIQDDAARLYAESEARRKARPPPMSPPPPREGRYP